VKIITRFFSPTSKNYATILLVVATFLSYLAGFFRDLIIAYTFGATGSTDAYFAAFLIPDVIFAFSAGGFLSGIFFILDAFFCDFDLCSVLLVYAFYCFFCI